MRDHSSRRRSRLDPITDRLRTSDGRRAGKLPTVILFAAVIGVLPLAYFLDRFLGGGWLVSALAAVAIAGILAFNAFLFIRN
jgi:hypothetical protein